MCLVVEPSPFSAIDAVSGFLVRSQLKEKPSRDCMAEGAVSMTRQTLLLIVSKSAGPSLQYLTRLAAACSEPHDQPRAACCILHRLCLPQTHRDLSASSPISMAFV